jgi:DNA polymerase III epsilon subunit-like protein
VAGDRFDLNDIYISADIEADGPIPGPYSMLSFGLAVAGTFDGTTFEPRNPSDRTFYRELKPISDHFDPGALQVSGLDREELTARGSEPSQALQGAARWVREQAGTFRAVLVGYPVVFDWLFLHWYFVRFAGESPFGFGSALDIKTIYHQKARVTFDRAGRDQLPPDLSSGLPHTHNALEDAIEQAEVFNRLFVWRGTP